MEADLGHSMLTFAADVYRRAKMLSNSKERNVVCSPFSIAAAAAMTLAGARGDTAKEIAEALHLEDNPAVHKHFLQLQESFKAYIPDVALLVANRMYCEKTFQPLTSYSTLLLESYGTAMESVDFKTRAEEIRQEINAWVEVVTKDKIKELLPPGFVTVSTVMILVNAIYFKGLWDRKFRPELTKPMDFHETSSKTSIADMMFQKGDFRVGYSEKLKATALELPYRGNKTSMVVLLPDEIGGLRSVEEALTCDTLLGLLGVMQKESGVEVYFPRFKIEETLNLTAVLQGLGVKKLFTPLADLSGIAGCSGISLSDAIHRAYVEVNEEGTEAAAATAMRVAVRCHVHVFNPRIFKVDHPFMFIILGHEPRLVLFLGSVRCL